MRNALRTGLQGLAEMLLYFPAVMLAAAWTIPQDRWWLWPLSLWIAYPAGWLTARFLHGKSRVIRLGVQVLLALLLALFLYGPVLPGWIYGIAAVYIGHRGALMSVRPWAEMFPMAGYWTGIGLYLVSSPLYHFVEHLKPFEPWMRGFGVLALVVALFATNQILLQSEADAGRKQRGRIASSALRHNRFYVGLLILFVAVLAVQGEIRRMLAEIRDRLAGWLNALLERMPETDISDEGGMTGPPPAFAEETGEPSAWARWLETVLLYAMYAVIAAVLLALTVFLVWRIIACSKRFFAGWRPGGRSASKRPTRDIRTKGNRC